MSWISDIRKTQAKCILCLTIILAGILACLRIGAYYLQ